MTDAPPAPTEEVELTGESAAAPDAATPFTFGNEAFRPMSALPALDRMSERMARRVRDVIEPFARAKPRVTAQPVAIRRFESWIGDQPEFTSLNMYRFRPLKGGILVAIEPAFISQLVDSFYGGTGSATALKGEEFTATEERLLIRLTEALMAALSEVWSEVVTVSPQFSSRETNTAYASLVRREEPVAIARFNITPVQGRETALDILYPVSSLRAVEADLASKMNDDGGFIGVEWRERMAAALREVRLEARSVLANPTMPLSDLMKLAPGDVIPISMPATVPLLVKGRVVAHGTIGDQDGRVAIKIEKMAHRSPNNE